MKPRLFTPGPTPVPEETLLELARPVTYHRSPEAKAILGEVTEDLKYVFQTAQPVYTLTCSGTGGMEAAVANTLAAGEKAILLHRRALGRTLARHPEGVRRRTSSRSRCPTARRSRPRCSRRHSASNPDTKAVFATLSETSTGVGHDLEAFGKTGREDRRALHRRWHQRSGCDGVPRRCLEDRCVRDRLAEGADAAAGAGICLGQREGVEEDRCRRRARASTSTCAATRSRSRRADTPFTPANTLIRAQRASLKRIRAEGIENLWARHARIAAACRAGVKAMGLEMFAEQPNNAPDGHHGARPASTAAQRSRNWRSSTASSSRMGRTRSRGRSGGSATWATPTPSTCSARWPRWNWSCWRAASSSKPARASRRSSGRTRADDRIGQG